MRAFLHGLLRILFVVYCIEAGLFLVLAPWRDVWGALVSQLPLLPAREMLATPLGRGAVTGFGLVHLVWGIHDASELMQRRSRPEVTHLPHAETALRPTAHDDSAAARHQ